MTSSTLLTMTGISKSFQGVNALNHVDFDLVSGEVHALIGENGAGKSTLMNILAGAISRDQGVVTLKGREINLRSPHDAETLGIAVIHQERTLISTLNAAHNIWLGREPSKRFGFIKKNELLKKSNDIMQHISPNVPLDIPVKYLSSAQQQLIEIAKAVSQKADIIVMDEPTSSLTYNETEALFKIIDNLKNEGKGIIYISHRMEEIFKVADRVTVLKDGCKVGTSKASDLTEDRIVQMMVGRKIENYFPKSNVQFGKTILKVVNFTRKKVFEDISFELHEGEILGLSGLVGAGRTELARAIFGADSKDSGRLYINGKEVKIKSPRDSIKKGIAFIPEDRKDQGVITRMTVRENLTLAVLDSIARSGIIDRVKQKKISDDYIKQLNIKTPNMEQKVMNLSGGNQQKVVIGKWLATNPKILILDEPTRGIDVASKVEIYTLMKDLAQKGIGALFISSELPEIVGVCDRILILREGKLVGDILKEEASEENIMNYFMGRAAQ